jgi:hypothetical protein
MVPNFPSPVLSLAANALNDIQLDSGDALSGLWSSNYPPLFWYFISLSLISVQSLQSVKNPFKMVDDLKISPGDSGIVNYPHVVGLSPSPPIHRN